MDRKLKEALAGTFTPPPPQNKERFIQTIHDPKAGFIQLLLSQIGFIRKRVWIGFALLLVSAFTITNFAQLPGAVVSSLSAMLPLYSLLAITEIHKSAAHNMAEMELACKYNLLKVTLMRLCILGLAGFVILLVYVALTTGNDYGAFRNLIYLSVPYLISTNLSLVVIAKCKSNETSYMCSAVSLGVSVSIIVLNGSRAFIYSANYTFAWAISFAVLIILFGVNLIKFKTSQEELQWNLL